MLRLKGWIYLGLLSTISFTWALSNLDASEPIVKRSPASDEDDFGLAVALHQVVEPMAGNFDNFVASTRYI